jgi:hypothetical protein
MKIECSVALVTGANRSEELWNLIRQKSGQIEESMLPPDLADRLYKGGPIRRLALEPAPRMPSTLFVLWRVLIHDDVKCLYPNRGHWRGQATRLA